MRRAWQLYSVTVGPTQAGHSTAQRRLRAALEALQRAMEARERVRVRAAAATAARKAAAQHQRRLKQSVADADTGLKSSGWDLVGCLRGCHSVWQQHLGCFDSIVRRMALLIAGLGLL